MRGKSITHNMFRIQYNESIASIEYMLTGKTLLDYTNLFSTNDNKKNYKIIHPYFKEKYDRRNKSTV